MDAEGINFDAKAYFCLALINAFFSTFIVMSRTTTVYLSIYDLSMYLLIVVLGRTSGGKAWRPDHPLVEHLVTPNRTTAWSTTYFNTAAIATKQRSYAADVPLRSRVSFASTVSPQFNDSSLYYPNERNWTTDTVRSYSRALALLFGLFSLYLSITVSIAFLRRAWERVQLFQQNAESPQGLTIIYGLCCGAFLWMLMLRMIGGRLFGRLSVDDPKLPSYVRMAAAFLLDVYTDKLDVYFGQRIESLVEILAPLPQDEEEPPTWGPGERARG